MSSRIRSFASLLGLSGYLLASLAAPWFHDHGPGHGDGCGSHAVAAAEAASDCPHGCRHADRSVANAVADESSPSVTRSLATGHEFCAACQFLAQPQWSGVAAVRLDSRPFVADREAVVVARATCERPLLPPSRGPPVQG